MPKCGAWRNAIERGGHDSNLHDRTVSRCGNGFCIQLSAEPSLAKFEDCLQQLEKIVEQLERGDLPLEQSLKLFEDGIRLSNSCRQELESAEGKVELLVKQSGKLHAEPFMEIEEEKTAK